MRTTLKIMLESSANFLRIQVFYIAVSAVGGATFWAIGQRINPLTVLMYGLAIGNLIVPVTHRLHRLYSERPFPYNWLLFLCFLFVLLLPIYVISSAFVCTILFWAAPLGLLGAVADGLSGYYYLLAVKAVMDGLAMASFVKMVRWPAGLS